MSLALVSSPRATEPKTRTLRAPWREAVARISARLPRRASSVRIMSSVIDRE
jgi:hypothetical protein